MFESAERYDRTINWEARLAREIPVLMDVFGAPSSGGLLDAGCGTGHQVAALAKQGYRVVGVDASQAMLDFASRHAESIGAVVRLIRTSYADLVRDAGTGFDGVYCLGNSLAAAATRDAAARAVEQFGGCLRQGGRVFVQILNFTRMRSQKPCVLAPRVATTDGVEYVSTRQFHFDNEGAEVTHVTVWNDNGWKHYAQSGRLYAIELSELREWLKLSGLRIDHLWGGYDRSSFDVAQSSDLIVVATRL